MKKLTSPGALVKESWKIFTRKENFIFLVKIYLPVGFLSLIALAPAYIPFLDEFLNSSFGGMVMAIFNLLFVATVVFVNLSGIIAITEVLDNSRSQVKSVYKEAITKYWRFLLLMIIVSLIFILSLILLIVPFVFALTWFTFSKFILVEKGIGIKMSLLESKKLVKGNFWRVFGRILFLGLFSVFSQMVLTFLPFGAGVVIFNLCGGFFLLPQLLLYQEMSSGRTLSG